MFISLLIFSIQNKQVAPHSSPFEFNCNMPETLTVTPTFGKCIHMPHAPLACGRRRLPSPSLLPLEDLCQMAEDQISCG